MKHPLIAVLASLVLSACQSYSPQRYTAVPDNAMVLKALTGATVRVSPFVLSAPFSASCRGGANIDPPVNLSYPGYLQAALSDELKVAGLYSEGSPRVTLSGDINRLEFSSTKSLTNGEWAIGLKITSTNGKVANASVLYKFESGFEGSSACRRTAEAFLPAVQELIAKLVRSAEFRALLEI